MNNILYQPVSAGGIGLETTIRSIVFLITTLSLVIYLTIAQRNNILPIYDDKISLN